MCKEDIIRIATEHAAELDYENNEDDDTIEDCIRDVHFETHKEVTSVTGKFFDVSSIIMALSYKFDDIDSLIV